MVSLKAPTPDVLEDIQRIHDLLILLELRILHNIYLLLFLLLLEFSVQLYTLKRVAIRNVLFLDGNVFSSIKPSVERLRDHTLEALSLCLDTLVLLDNQIEHFISHY